MMILGSPISAYKILRYDPSSSGISVAVLAELQNTAVDTKLVATGVPVSSLSCAAAVGASFLSAVPVCDKWSELRYGSNKKLNWPGLILLMLSIW
jgi:hypothetical protein